MKNINAIFSKYFIVKNNPVVISMPQH